MEKEINDAEPLEYVKGFTEFLGCKIDLSKKPLIPRQETEFWVQKAIKAIHHNCNDRRNYDVAVLDMFAGSGCIGIAISRHVKNAEVTFADKYKYFDSPNFVRSDVFSNIKGKFDFIFANPPYIPTTRRNRIQKSVLKFEPKTALFGGNDGLFYIRKFLKGAKKHLNSCGRIFMEFDGSTGSPQAPPQKKKIENLLKKYNYKNYKFHRDQLGRWRWVSAG
jgi:release factor glutamine methyltransferase